MATINDFKVLNQLSANYFSTFVAEDFQGAQLQKLEKLSDLYKSRLGFYILMVEQLTHLADYVDIAKCVIDSEFNHLLYDDASDDFGVDAVVIDDDKDERHIKLFNFKFRENFKGASPAINETILSSKYLNAINNNDFKGMSGKPLAFAQEIRNCIMSNNTWKITLYVISNEDFPTTATYGHLKQFQDAYGLHIEQVGLNRIADLISLRPSPVSATIVLDRDAVMSFTESSLSSSKSYIFRLSLAELIRITSEDEALRLDYNIEDLSKLSDTSLNASVLFDNVRGFVLRSKFNKNIAETIKVNPTKFFMYNNGLTLIANDVVADLINGKNKLKIVLSDFQVLNGGQTLRTIYDFNKDDVNNISEYLSKSEVLVRVFKTQNHLELNSEIAEFTNSQNAISNVDLKSLRKEQISLEQFLQSHDILYSRKTGDTGVKRTRSYKTQISMEKFGQILMAYQNMPEKAVNAKKNIFDKYYDDLFTNNTTLLDDSVDQINMFQAIRDSYKALSDVDFTDQKAFYVIYIVQNSDLDINSAITLLEAKIEEYLVIIENTSSKSRILIQIAFKKLINVYLEELKKPQLVEDADKSPTVIENTEN